MPKKAKGNTPPHGHGSRERTRSASSSKDGASTPQPDRTRAAKAWGTTSSASSSPAQVALGGTESRPQASRADDRVWGRGAPLSFRAVRALFPLLDWSEEFRADLMLAGYVLLMLIVQLRNVYRLNITNYLRAEVGLCAILLLKRPLYGMLSSIMEEVLPLAPRPGTGGPAADEHRRKSKPLLLTVLVAVLFGGLMFLIGFLLVVVHKAPLVRDGVRSAVGGPFAAIVPWTRIVLILAPAVLDFGIMCYTTDRRVTADGGEDTWDARRVANSLRSALYVSLEATYFACFLPVFFANERVFYYDVWICQLTGLYCFLNCFTLLLTHALATGVVEYARWGGQVWLIQEGEGADGAMPQVYAAIFGTRFLMVLFLVRFVLHPTHWATFCVLLVGDYCAVRRVVHLYLFSRQRARDAEEVSGGLE